MVQILAIAKDEPFAPTWLVMPLALVVMLLLIVHVRLLRREAMPASRKRIRMANGVLMMVGTPLIAYAMGVVTPAQARLFPFAWVAVAGVVVVVLFLAVMDMLNTWRLASRERRAISADVLAKLPRSDRTGRGENSPA